MNLTTPIISEDKVAQHHHATHNPTVQSTVDNGKDSRNNRMCEERMQTGEAKRLALMHDTLKGSGGHEPPVKNPKHVKAIKKRIEYQTWLIPGINTEKHPNKAKNEDKD